MDVILPRLRHFLGKEKLNFVLEHRMIPNGFGECGLGVYATYNPDNHSAGSTSRDEPDHILLFDEKIAQECFEKTKGTREFSEDWRISKGGAEIIIEKYNQLDEKRYEISRARLGSIEEAKKKVEDFQRRINEGLKELAKTYYKGLAEFQRRKK